MKAIFVFLIPDYTDLNGFHFSRLRGFKFRVLGTDWVSRIPSLQFRIICRTKKSKSLLLTDYFPEGSGQAMPRNEGYPRDHFP